MTKPKLRKQSKVFNFPKKNWTVDNISDLLNKVNEQEGGIYLVSGKKMYFIRQVSGIYYEKTI